MSMSIEEYLLIFLGILMISSSVFLFINYFKRGMNLPILESKSKRYRYNFSSKIEKSIRSLTIKNELNVDIKNYTSSNKNPISLLPDNKELSYVRENKSNINFINYKNNNKKFPFVSVIVPVRNEAEFIERCIISILSQNYPYFELIIVDDNSSDNTLKIIKDIKSNKNYKSIGLPVEKLKIVSLKGKPDDWTGKTWASEQGFLESKGDILLFTDGDTNYVSKDVILQSISYMQKEKLDVLTGVPSSENLSNISSKITIPFWESIFSLFGVNSSKVNDPKSKVAFLIGCFIVIKRKVFVDIGTFESVHDALQEDKALGVILKNNGHNLQLVKLKEMVYTIWCDDLKSLWYGIGRTLAPIIIKNKAKIISNICIIFFASVLPFILLPFTLISNLESFSNLHLLQGLFISKFILLISEIIPCSLILSLFLIKSKEYGINPLYSLTALFSSLFIFVACLYNVIPIIIQGKSKSILWQNRCYTYNKQQEGFTI